MDIEEFIPVLINILVIVIIFAVIHLISFLTSRWHDVRFNNEEQFKNLKAFLRKHRLRYKVLSSDGLNRRINEQISMQSGYIHVEHNLKEIIQRVYWYGKAKRFFSEKNIIENSYFKAEYLKHNILLTDFSSGDKVRINKYYDDIWFEIIKNITDDLMADELWNLLQTKNLVRKNNVQKIKSKNYLTLKEEQKEKKRNKRQIKENKRSKKRRILDVNNCTIEQLNSLPGITVIIAKRLIKYRDENGGFSSPNDFWENAKLSPHIKYMIEKKKIIKTKKVKNTIFRIIENTISKTIERMVDI